MLKIVFESSLNDYNKVDIFLKRCFCLFFCEKMQVFIYKQERYARKVVCECKRVFLTDNNVHMGKNEGITWHFLKFSIFKFLLKWLASLWLFFTDYFIRKYNTADTAVYLPLQRGKLYILSLGYNYTILSGKRSHWGKKMKGKVKFQDFY